MAVSSRSELFRRLTAYARPLLVGAALAVVAFTGGTLMLYEARGALPAAGGLLATFRAALAAGRGGAAAGVRRAAGRGAGGRRRERRRRGAGARPRRAVDPGRHRAGHRRR